MTEIEINMWSDEDFTRIPVPEFELVSPAGFSIGFSSSALIWIRTCRNRVELLDSVTDELHSSQLQIRASVTFAGFKNYWIQFRYTFKPWMSELARIRAIVTFARLELLDSVADEPLPNRTTGIQAGVAFLDSELLDSVTDVFLRSELHPS
ncbi:hypothetical protein NPIL_79261 [Nephila pilipes]|uniref:Uncharacterized protein n=1 Tax=Nephila pilipes TaxID=299642 RepID=A0A8X6P2F7_NEPPI|nr:hypothetical protein NPIL_79261 [Nephila pilipes]